MGFIPEITLPLSNPVLIFGLLMGLILVAPQVVQKFKVPGIVGLIIAGALIGPSMLNLIEHNPEAIPPDFMGLLGTAGLMYLMFQAGLSLDLARFNQLKGRSIGFGAISFFIPQLLTLLVALTVLDFSVEAAFLMGSIIGSHTLIAYPIVARMGLVKNTAVTMTLGGTLVTDTLSLSILAVVVASVSGDTSPAFWMQFGVGVAIFVLVVLWGLPRVGYIFFRTVRNKPEVEFGFLLTVLFLMAWLAEFVGLAPIIGAFVAGLAMNRLVPSQGTIMARVNFVGQALFIPFFLIYVGLLIDVGALFESVNIWILAAVLIALVSVGKLVAAKVAQRIFDYSADEGWVIYGLSVPQAAATLAVTLVGYDLGIFETDLVNAVVLMILVSCVLGTTIVEKFGLKVAHTKEVSLDGVHQTAERILVPLANPETSENLMEMAFLIRDPSSEEPIYSLMVVRDGLRADDLVTEQRQRLQHAMERGAEAGVPVRPLTRIDMNPAYGIARTAREEQASMILIGWSGKVSARERIFGSVLDQLLGETKQLVLVNRILHPPNTVSDLLVLVPPFAERCPGFLRAAGDLKLMASRMDARLRLVCVDAHCEQDELVFQSATPEMEMEVTSVANWSELPTRLDEMVTESTLIAAVSARPHTAPWFPELDGMPRTLAARFPDHSFTVVFLPIES